MPQPVFVNARYEGRPTTGVERYAGEVVARLGAKVTLLRPARARRGAAGHAWEQLVLPRRLPADGLLWSPANSGPLRVASQVVTIHDASPLDHPEWFAPLYARWYGWLIPRLAQRVRRVITGSQFARNRLLAHCRIPPSRLTVIPPGVDRSRFAPQPATAVAAIRQSYDLPPIYLLFVGSLEPRKNLARLLEAWQRTSAELPDAALVLAGAPGRVFKGAGLPGVAPGVRRLGRVPETHLPALYSGATAFVIASLYEGFGLTALEAMACGTPVLASTAGALPEVVGDAALLFDPLDTSAIAASLSRALKDADLRRRAAPASLAQAATFSWDRTAQDIWTSLRSV